MWTELPAGEVHVHDPESVPVVVAGPFPTDVYLAEHEIPTQHIVQQERGRAALPAPQLARTASSTSVSVHGPMDQSDTITQRDIDCTERMPADRRSKVQSGFPDGPASA